MHRPLLLLPALAFGLTGSEAADQIFVIGDSLTKEYQISFPGVPAAGVSGIDSDHPAARNWCEILHVRRNASFDLGLFKGSLLSRWTDLRLLGHEYDWAVPGATARSLRDLVTGQDLAELTTDSNYTTFIAFAPDWMATPARMTVQLQTSAEGAVIWCGGNDLRFGNTDPAAKVGGTRVTYATIYHGDGTGAGNPQPLMDSLRQSIQSIATFVKSANPSLPLAICAVPHVGGTPAVQATAPTDPVRTARVSTALETLNAELRTWTETTLDAAWVDTYLLTKNLITQPVVIGGVTFQTAADPLTAADPPGAHNRYLFAQDGFHPTTAAQALVARAAQAALRTKYPLRYGGSAPLTEREIIVDVCGIPAATGFNEFMAASGAPAGQRGETDDPDGDGLANALEFALAGLSPVSGDMAALPVSALDTSGGSPFLTLTWAPRFAENAWVSLVCQQSTSLQSTDWSDVPAASVVVNANGSQTAWIPVTSGARMFLRLKAVITP